MRSACGLLFALTLVIMNLGVSFDDSAPPRDKRRLNTTVGATAVRNAGDRQRPTTDPHDEITADRLIGTLRELTSIGDHNGWRHSTSDGEKEAIGYVQERLSKMAFLQTIGIEVEKQHFRTYMGVEFRRSSVHLMVDLEEFEIPADAIPGDRERLDLALQFDSDGVLNDTSPDPVTVQGPAVIVQTLNDLEELTSTDVAGRIVLLNYGLIDRVVNDRGDAIERARRLAELQPAGIVMITTYSNERGLSHGSFAGDLPAFNWVEVDPMPPVLLVRIEDMEAAGLHGW